MDSQDLDKLLWEIDNHDLDQSKQQTLLRPDNQSSTRRLQATSYSRPSVHSEGSLSALPFNAHKRGGTGDTTIDAFDQELLHVPQNYWPENDTISRPHIPLGYSGSVEACPSDGLGRSHMREHQPYAFQKSLDTVAGTSSQERDRIGQSHISHLPGPDRAGFGSLRHQFPNIRHSPPRGLSSSPLALPSSPSLAIRQRREDHKTRVTSSYSTQNDTIFSSPRTNLKPRPRPTPQTLAIGHAPPMAQGIQLISLNDLPDRFRSIFPFALFNAVQSKCFQAVYKSNDNLVLAAPTGSGKTAILELAICRLISGYKSDHFKIVYQAPTKSLCSERQRDWQTKFGPLDLQCAELTGDTDQAQLRNVQNASIIITTPEKWDSVTRKWKDHQKLMHMVKLFLIDEVHILKDTRGATLEAVVSRMKSVGSSVRFVALSATVPNSEDIASWLGKDFSNQYLPAHRETFGEDFRPVRLRKYVYGFQSNGNDFSFDKVCESKLPEIIAKHSHKKPIMIFCCTRNSAIQTAKMLANLWATKGPRDRLWPSPTQPLMIKDADLRNCTTSGVAFHHAGIEASDRAMVEKAYLKGQISVICCTSTLAVGVNLPCHLAIVKNTVSWQGTACKEYADLEVMQMLGRAGRPQFDDSAVAVIMTRKERVQHYEKMVSGQEILESCLHLNLIDHLNAEVGLGTISDLHTAKRWLAGTFLYVRLRQNPNHYKLEGGTQAQSLDENIEQICRRNIQLLEETGLVSSDGKIESTEFGDAMSRYYVKFETMKTFLALREKAKISEIVGRIPPGSGTYVCILSNYDLLSALAQADEFHELRLKGNEKSLYKEINRANGIKFPIKVDLALTAQKVSLIIQFELGGVDFPSGEQFQKHKIQFQQDKAIIFQHVHRLIRCIVDCQIYLKDSKAVRHALELARSLGARVWDNSPLQLRQIEQVGLIAVRKLVTAGISSIETLQDTEAYRIEMIMSRNPPYGSKLLSKLKQFPKLRVNLKMMGKEVKASRPVRVKIKADIGFMNEKVPTVFNRKPIYVVFLAETSDGELIDFRRIYAKKLDNGQDVHFSADLTNVAQYITCYVMCDDIAGTMKYADLKPDLPASIFPPPKPNEHASELPSTTTDGRQSKINMNICRRRSTNGGKPTQEIFKDDSDEFGDGGVDDGDLVAAVGDLDFSHIHSYHIRLTHETRQNTLTNREANGTARAALAQNANPWEPIQLANGKWACNHACKDKTTCKHMCCRDGLDKPPKAPKKSSSSSRSTIQQSHLVPHGRVLKQQNLDPNESITQKDACADIEVIDLAKSDFAKTGLRDYRKLDRLHSSVQNPTPISILPQRPKFSYLRNSQPELSFLKKNGEKPNNKADLKSWESDDSWTNDVPSPPTIVKDSTTADEFATNRPVEEESSRFDDDLSSLEACMIGLEDSINLEAGSMERDINKSPSPPAGTPNLSLEYADIGQGLKWSSSPVRNQQASQLPGVTKSSAQFVLAQSKNHSIFLSTPTNSDRYDQTGSISDSGTMKQSKKRLASATPSPEVPDVPAKKQKLSKRRAISSNFSGLVSSTEATTLSDSQEPKEGDEGFRRPGWEGVDQEIYDMFKDIVDIVPEGKNN